MSGKPALDHFYYLQKVIQGVWFRSYNDAGVGNLLSSFVCFYDVCLVSLKEKNF